MNSNIFYVFYGIICFILLIVGVVMRICLDKELKKKIVEHNESLVSKYNDNECTISNIWFRDLEFLKSRDCGSNSCDFTGPFMMVDYRGKYDSTDIGWHQPEFICL